MWEAFGETGLPIGLHVGGRRPGTPTASIYESAPRFMTGLVMSKLTMAESVSELIHGLVMQRYPELKFIAVEGQIGWISFFLYYSDHLYEKHRFWTKSELEGAAEPLLPPAGVRHVHGRPRRSARARVHRDRQHHVGERLPALRDHVAQLQGAHRRVVHALRRRREGQDPLEELRQALRAGVVTAVPTRRGGRRSSFEQSELMAVALELGPDNLDMRSVADALAVPRTTVYNHVRSPEELGRLVLSSLLDAWQEPARGPLGVGSLPAQLEAFAMRLRDRLLSVGPWLRYYDPDVHVAATTFRDADYLIGRLVEEGFAVETAGHALSLVTSVVNVAVGAHGQNLARGPGELTLPRRD